MISYYLI